MTFRKNLKNHLLIGHILLLSWISVQAAPMHKKFNVFPKDVNHFNFCVSALSLPHQPNASTTVSSATATAEAFQAFHNFENSLVEDSPYGIDNRTQWKHPPHLYFDGKKKLTTDELQALRKRIARITFGVPSSEWSVGYHVSGAQEIISSLSQLSSLNASLSQSRNLENFQRDIDRNIKRAPLAPLAMLGSIVNITYSFLPSGPSVLLFAGSAAALTHVCLKNSFILMKNTMKSQNKILPQTLNSIAGSIYQTSHQQIPNSGPTIVGDQRFAYVGYSLTLPSLTIRQAIAKSKNPNSQIDLNHLVAFFAKLDTIDQIQTKATSVSTDFEPRRVEFDFYFDLNNPASPEMYLYIRVWEDKICSIVS